MKRPSSAPATSRSVARDVLVEWSRQSRYAAELIEDRVRQAGLSPQDHAFVHDLVLTTLRHLSLLDHWIGELTAQRHLDHRARWLLRLGLVQLLILDVPPHAAVNETVGIAGPASALVNAVLRRVTREKDALLAQRSALPPEIQYSHPRPILKRWIAQHGEPAAIALAEWNQHPAPVFVRQNPLISESAAHFDGNPSLHPIGEGFYRCDSLPREALAAGWCYAQDPSTALAVRALAPQPGENVLDACAAPGGKTALIAALMGNQGKIVATDNSSKRLKRWQENIDRLGVTCALSYTHDWTKDQPSPTGDLLFDRILLDVPCSNSGVIRRRVDVRWRLDPERDFPAMAVQQGRLIDQVLTVLRPGGTLAYSTCSIDHEENGGVVEAALRRHPRLSLIQSHLQWPPSTGMDGAFFALLRLNQ